MKRQRLVSALLIIGLCSASALGAQSTIFDSPQRGPSSADDSSELTALSAMIAINQSRVNAQDYLYNHPLFGPSRRAQGPLAATPLAAPRDANLLAERRPECPMPVTKSALKSDSMPVQRPLVRNAEPMPVSASLCVNPLRSNP